MDRDPGDATRFTHWVFENKSAIVKSWKGANRRLQEGKRTNIALAAPLFDGVLIRPGQLFSFYRLLGRPSAKRGFCPGYEVSGQGLGQGIGGGLCQLASSLLWVMLHAGFDVIERHHHDFDLFPDENRRVPFGTGASVFHNHHDLRLQNRSGQTARLSVRVMENELAVGLSSEDIWAGIFSIEERDHRFTKDPAGIVYRSNSIHRVKKDGAVLSETLLWKNRSRVLYPITL
ncbi:MAG: VanW family protein [Elusimicrobia bacterium]|nr:VanW family protein [Elusimicrobiota bacterium]